MDRKERYTAISKQIKSISDDKLLLLIANATPIHVGIDGKTFALTLDEHCIFVKKIPLSDIEMKSENSMSTANHFKLPLFCQYGIGAPGFGSWRELTANQQATNWVISNKCENFSLLYHWRVLPAPPAKPMTPDQLKNLDQQVLFWENSKAVRSRFESLHFPSAEIILFLEFVPQTLTSWIKSKYAQGNEVFERALAFTDQNLNNTIDFMSSQGLIHFDTHFENIMTDGERLYFNDFGLAMSDQFELDQDERVFFEQHRNYDRCRASIGLVHAMITAIYGENDWKDNLHKFLESRNSSLSPFTDAVLRKYGRLATAMIEFSQKLKNESKRTPFPAELFSQILSKNNY